MARRKKSQNGRPFQNTPYSPMPTPSTAPPSNLPKALKVLKPVNPSNPPTATVTPSRRRGNNKEREDVERLSDIPKYLRASYRLLYEPALLVCALNPVRGKDNHGKRPYGPGVAEGQYPSPRELMRSFLDCVAYICDYIPGGGDTVSAAAFARIPGHDGPVLVLAGNTKITDENVNNLKVLFKDLSSYAKDITAHGHESSTRMMWEENNRPGRKVEILRFLISIGRKRLAYYQRRAQKALEPIEEAIKRDHRISAEDVISKLRTVINTCELDVSLVKCCHNLVQQKVISTLRQRLRTSSSSSDLCYKLYHCFGRVGALNDVAETFLRVAEEQNPYFFDDLTIWEPLLPPPLSLCPLVKTKCTGESILGRFENDTEPIEALRGDFDFFNEMFYNRNLDNILQASSQVKDQSNPTKDVAFKTRVHAELQLINYFTTPRAEHEDQIDFFDREDRYIGSSKPACYLCNLYVESLRLIRPIHLRGTHGKIYMKWKPPDLAENPTENDIKTRKKVMQEMYDKVRLEAQRELRGRLPPRRKGEGCHYDSTTGVSGANWSVTSSVRSGGDNNAPIARGSSKIGVSLEEQLSVMRINR